MKKPLSASPKQDTDFFGNPVWKPEQIELPKEAVIEVKTSIPHPGDRITHVKYGVGTVLSVGEMAQMEPANRSIEVRFDSGEKWFVAQQDLVEA